MLHQPDVRLTDIRLAPIAGPHPFHHQIAEEGRALFVYVLQGRFRMAYADGADPPVEIAEGTAVGFQNGRAHSWTGVGKGRFELFTASIDRRAALLQGLDRGTIVVPPEAEPYAAVIRRIVEVIAIDHQRRRGAGDDLVVRRCAEIIMAELIAYAREALVDAGEVPQAIAHDQYLLRAWIAYYADPRRRWTVQALAAAAGLSRTAFAARFTKAMGTPPLAVLTDMRLDQARTLLRYDSPSLTEIAFMVGYSSEAAFVRAFRRRFGLPPGRYRQVHGEPKTRAGDPFAAARRRV